MTCWIKVTNNKGKRINKCGLGWKDEEGAIEVDKPKCHWQ
jgi:hypothetical protein